jgi:septum site-determining protein MinD
MVSRGEMLSIEDIIDILAIQLIGVIPEDENILIGSNQGTPVAMASMNGTSATQAFRNIAGRLEGEEIPYMDLKAKEGFFSKLSTWFSGN